jgi:hypothetical protein
LKCDPCQQGCKGQIRSDASEGDNEVPNDEKWVMMGVLNGMAGFMCGHAHSRERPLLIVPCGEPQDFLGRVIMIGQLPSHGLDLNILDASRIHHHSGRFSPGGS